MQKIGEEIIQKLDEKIEERVKARRKEKHKYNRASSIGWVDDCKLHLVLKRLCPEEEALPEEDQQRRLDEGLRQEKIIAEELQDAGFHLEKCQRIINDELQIEGEVEYRLVHNGNKFPLDFKTCSSWMFRQISRLQSNDELLGSPHIWVRHYSPQMQIYDFLYEEDVGLLLFKDKDVNRKHVIDVPYDQVYTEHLIDEIHEVNWYVKKGDLLKPVYTDACKYCGFFAHCFPDSDFVKKKIAIVTDEEMELKLQRWYEIEKIGKEFKKLDEEIKGYYRGETLIIGDFLIKSTQFTATAYDIPDDVKKKYARPDERFRMTIKNIISAI